MLIGIVVKPPNNIAIDLSLDQVAATVVTSEKVSPAQLQIARHPHRQFLVLLPATLNKDDVVAAIPKAIWDRGFTFHSYSSLFDTSISIPLFKLWINVEGVPLELNNEAHMARAVSSFSLYLRSMEPQIHGDCHSCSIFIAMDDLVLVSHQLEFKIGGMVYNVRITPRKWIKGQIYHREDLPPNPTSYHPPTPPLNPLPVPANDHVQLPPTDPI